MSTHAHHEAAYHHAVGPLPPKTPSWRLSRVIWAALAGLLLAFLVGAAVIAWYVTQPAEYRETGDGSGYAVEPAYWD